MLPTTDVLLLGPGPSPVSPRVLAALAAPPRSHLDPDLLAHPRRHPRAARARVPRARQTAHARRLRHRHVPAWKPPSPTSSSPARRALAVVTGYFGDRLATMLARYGADVERLDVRVGTRGRSGGRRTRARRALATDHRRASCTPRRRPACAIRSPTSRGIARAHGALIIVDAVTSLGAMPLEMASGASTPCYSCSQKGLGAPSGLAPVAFSPRALDRRVTCRSFYLDLALLEDYWLRRKYHHTISAPLVYALQRGARGSR